VSAFYNDNDWQRGMRDRVLAPSFYDGHALQGRYVFMDKGRFATILQKRYAVDTILQSRDGSAVCIEEKIVRWKGRHYDSFFLETRSCTVPGHESTGWMTYAEADYLLYCFAQENDDLDCYLIDFPELQAWFWKHDTEFPSSRMETENRTEGRLVPIATVQANVRTWRRHVACLQPMEAA
jgi:hypothetical protein